MFIVFDKNKIYSYLVSLTTVAILFTMSFAMSASNNKIVETAANIIEKNNIQQNLANENFVKK